MVSATDIDFLYDLGSPNAFLVHRALPRLEAAHAVRFVYRPVLLGAIFKATGNQSPYFAFGHIAPKFAYIRTEIERFIRRQQIPRFALNPHFPVNTLLAMRGALAADRLGCAPAYVEAVFAALWEDGGKLDDPAVWHETVAQAGLPADDLAALAADPAIKADLAARTNAAIARGVFGLPTFFVGDEMWFGKECLAEVIEAATGA